MKKTLFVIVCMISVITYAQPPLKTLMEVEYVNSGYGLGTGMLGLGDINGDGKPDFAVSAGNIGKTFIYFGGKGVLDSAVDVVIKGGGQMAKGDLNGDGKMDLVVALQKGSSSETLYVYFGKTPTPYAIDTVPNIIIPRDSTGGYDTRFGETFAIGDINGDGFDDLVVGARGYGSLQGRVYIYYGGSNFSGIANEIVMGESQFYKYHDSFGYKINIADINGDGIKDLAISSDRRIYDSVGGYWKEDGYLDIFYGKQGWNFTKNGYNQRFNKTNTGLLYTIAFGLVDVNVDGKVDISIVQGDSAYFFCTGSVLVQQKSDFLEK